MDLAAGVTDAVSKSCEEVREETVMGLLPNLKLFNRMQVYSPFFISEAVFNLYFLFTINKIPGIQY